MRRTKGVLATQSVSVEAMEYAAGLCIPRHSHQTSHLVYIVSGPHWSGHSSGGGDCAPGTVRYLPAGEPHENYFPVACRTLEVVLQPPILELAREHGAALPAPGELSSRSAGALGSRLHRELRHNDDAAALEIEAITLRLLLTNCDDGLRRERCVPPWLLRVRELLHENGVERLRLMDLARCARRHPVQISREFHRYFGCTIGEYLRQVRVARAQNLLSRGEMSMAEIALACGFADQSHFTTAFRRLTGVPPRRFRDARFETERQTPARD